MAGPGRATSGRPTLQTSSNQRDSNHLARTPVTNVVNLRPKTLILSEKALGLTTFVTTDQKSTRKTPPIDDVCNNTQRSAPKSQHDKPNRIGGPENPAAVPVGGGGARPGFEPTRQATQQHPSPTGVEGAGGAGGHGRAAKRGAWPRCRWAVAGPGRASRSTTPSRRLACGDLAGGPPPTGTHSGPAPQVWRAPEGPEGTGGLRGAAPNEVRPPSLAGGRGLRRPEHPWGHKQHHTRIQKRPPGTGWAYLSRLWESNPRPIHYE